VSVLRITSSFPSGEGHQASLTANANFDKIRRNLINCKTSSSLLNLDEVCYSFQNSKPCIYCISKVANKGVHLFRIKPGGS